MEEKEIMFDMFSRMNGGEGKRRMVNVNRRSGQKNEIMLVY